MFGKNVSKYPVGYDVEPKNDRKRTNEIENCHVHKNNNKILSYNTILLVDFLI